MAEGTYEFEVMRSELLGIEPPNRTVFEAKQQEQERMAVQQEEVETEKAKELDTQEEQIQGNSGKLDDLNHILKNTQLKLNKFKGVCGSLTNLLRIRGDSKNNSTETLNNPGTSMAKDANLTVNDGINALDAIEAEINLNTTEQIRATKFDLDKQMTSHLDKLDSLLNKAERAEMSMEQQNKQMKGFMR